MKKDFKNTITITFGDQAENHVGMQKIGKMAEEGFSPNELEQYKKEFEEEGYVCELIDLNKNLPDGINADKASVLIVRDGINCLLKKINKTCDDLYDEQNNLEPDKKVKAYGKIMNKNARYNLCFDEYSQEPDYNVGKGRIVSYDNVPLTKTIRESLPEYLGPKARDLCAEGNYYYDVSKCGIGYHGDSERKRVIGVRLGATIPLHYQWFSKGKPIGEKVVLELNHGDIYVMSEKASGFDWKKKNIPTLRHAAGCKKFLEIKTRNKK